MSEQEYWDYLRGTEDCMHAGVYNFTNQWGFIYDQSYTIGINEGFLDARMTMALQ